MEIRRHTDLQVYKKAFDAAMLIFAASKKFPKEETYSLTDQIRRSSRGLCQPGGSLAEAPLYGGIYFETIRRGKRSCRNPGLARGRD
jgi:hypothetical protein